MATATIKLMGATYSDVPSVDLADGSGNFNNFKLTSDATMVSTDLRSGEIGYNEDGMVIGSLEIKTVYVGAGEPSSSLGENGDIYLRTM